MEKLLINTYSEAEVQIWCQLTWEKGAELELEELSPDSSRYDLEPEKEEPKTFNDLLKEEKTEGTIGVLQPLVEYEGPRGPGWYDYDVCEIGLYDVIMPGDFNPYGSNIEDWAAWAISHGVAPNQPFLLSLPRPHYTRYGGYYEEEWDAEYYHDVIDRLPISDAEALERWSTYFKDFGLEIPWVTKPQS